MNYFLYFITYDCHMPIMDSQGEETVRLLTNATNRAILSTLNSDVRSFSVREMAERLVSKDVTSIRSDQENIDRTIILLHLVISLDSMMRG